MAWQILQKKNNKMQIRLKIIPMWLYSTSCYSNKPDLWCYRARLRYQDVKGSVLSNKLQPRGVETRKMDPEDQADGGSNSEQQSGSGEDVSVVADTISIGDAEVRAKQGHDTCLFITVEGSRVHQQ